MERLTGDTSWIERKVSFLYGLATTDNYITPDYREVSFEQALYETLKDQGFDRIVFFNSSKRIFFFDEDSRRLSLAGSADRDRINSQQNHPLAYGIEGPLGKRRITQAPNHVVETGSVREQEENRNFGQIDDATALRTLDTFMKDVSVRSAIVITQAETTMRHLEVPATAESRMGSWLNLPSTNRNVCIFVYACDDLVAELKTHPDYVCVPEFKERVLQSSKDKAFKYCFHITSPDEAEVERMLNYARLRFDKKVVWREIDDIKKRIANDGQLLSHWLLRLRAPSFEQISLSNVRRCLTSDRPGQLPWREELDNMVGLQGVRERIKSFEAQMKRRMARIRRGKIKASDTPMFLHMAFLGNPGTGKTKIAGLIGEMYRDLGLLKKGHVITPDFSDLVGENADATSIKTNRLIDDAIDGVLFIDEAYQLADSTQAGTGQTVIDTLIPRLTNDAEHLAVVVAGYPDEMEQFFKVNRGMNDRIPTRIIFEDYTPDELMEIHLKFLKKEGFTSSTEFERAIKQVIQGLFKTRDPKRFGNARRMETLAKEIIARYSIIEDADSEVPLNDRHIPEEYMRFLTPETPEEKEIMQDLDALVGLDGVKKQVQQLRYDLQAEKARREMGQKPVVWPLHLTFTGNPGTGKTTVASLYARILKSVGILTTDNVTRVRATDLIKGYVGQTAEHATKEFMKALDGVLFIDEAHHLAVDKEGQGHSFNKDVIQALMQFMDTYPDRVVVISAGYRDGIPEFLRSDPGLPGRFTDNIDFSDYSVEELVEIFKRLAAARPIEVPNELIPLIAQYIQMVKDRSGASFQNARVANTLFRDMQKNQNKRYDQSKNPDDLKSFTREDIEGLLQSPLESKPIRYKHYNVIAHLPDKGLLADLDSAKRCVGVLHVSNSKNPAEKGVGTGFIVSPEGYLLTAYHVVQSSDEFTFRLDGSEEVLPATLLGFHEPGDLAVLALPPKKEKYPWIPLCGVDEVPEYGLDLWTIGYPLGEEFGQEITITGGQVSSLRENNSWIQITNPVTHGNSGGPVIRKSDFKAIGVLCSGAKDSRALMNFARSVSDVYRLFGPAPINE